MNKVNIPDDLKQRIQRAVPDISPYSIPIVRFDKDVPSQFGTGSLVEIGNDVVLLTAAHVFHRWKILGGALALGVEKRFLALTEPWLTTDAKSKLKGCGLDVGLTIIPAKDHPRLAGIPRLRIPGLEVTDVADYEYYLFAGYPGVASNPGEFEGDPFISGLVWFGATKFLGDPTGWQDFDPRVHFVVNGGSKYTFCVDPQGKDFEFLNQFGKPVVFPRDLDGASGCLVWGIGRPGSEPEQWREHGPHVVGMHTSNYPGGEVEVTRIDKILPVFFKLGERFARVLEVDYHYRLLDLSGD